MSLAAHEHQQRSQCIEVQLESFLIQHAPKILGFYWPWRGEFDCRPLIIRLLQQYPALRVCLPCVRAPGEPLEFRDWNKDSPLSTDRYGIAYPSEGPVLLPDTLLIPVNAFDAKGYRLGYGAGYYDRTLAVLKPRPFTLGIGFELARVEDLTPQAHDIPLNALLTEDRLEIFNASPSLSAY